MTQMELTEVLMYAEELLTVLVGDDAEATLINSINELSKQITALRQKQLHQLKGDVQYLTNDMNVSDEVGDLSETPAFLSNLEASLCKNVEAVQIQMAQVSKECQQTKEALAEVQGEQKALKEQRQSQKEAKTAALPKARCDANLYSNITNIRWQFNTEPHEVKGYICNNSAVKTFNLNSQEVSRFFISNYIWDLIEEDW